jgi:hypothetical protein
MDMEFFLSLSLSLSLSLTPFILAFAIGVQWYHGACSQTLFLENYLKVEGMEGPLILPPWTDSSPIINLPNLGGTFVTTDD